MHRDHRGHFRLLQQDLRKERRLRLVRRPIGHDELVVAGDDLGPGPGLGHDAAKLVEAVLEGRGGEHQSRRAVTERLGEPPLQTELTTSLTPFVELRKKRDKLYGEPWPDPREFEATIAEVERSVGA